MSSLVTDLDVHAKSSSKGSTVQLYETFYNVFSGISRHCNRVADCIHIHIHIHIRRLLLNGVVCMMQDKFEAAETFFEATVTFEPQSILAWTMFGLLLDNTQSMQYHLI